MSHYPQMLSLAPTARASASRTSFDDFLYPRRMSTMRVEDERAAKKSPISKVKKMVARLKR
jgi:hypothetical protein